VDVDRQPVAVLARTARAAHVAARVRGGERHAIDAERDEVAAGLVEGHGERAVDHERVIDGSHRDAAERPEDLDGVRDSRARRLLPRDVARVELGPARLVVGRVRGSGGGRRDEDPEDEHAHGSSVSNRPGRASSWAAQTGLIEDRIRVT